MRRRLVALAAVLAAAAVMAPAGAYPRPGTTIRVSHGNDAVDAEEQPSLSHGASHVSNPAISADGRYVVFVSRSPTQVPRDANSAPDVFRWDRLTGRTELVSTGTTGRPGTGACRHLESDSVFYGGSYAPATSADGRYVAFASCAVDLVVGDTNLALDVFVRDMTAGVTTRVSVASNGAQAIGPPEGETPYHPAISADGRHVAFVSRAGGLVPGGTNSKGQIYVHDRTARRTTRVSVGAGGVQGDDASFAPALSANGRFVAFPSGSTNLVPGVTGQHVFVRDLVTGRNEVADVGLDGLPGNASAGVDATAISADGRYVAFDSCANNLVPSESGTHLICSNTYDAFVRDRVTRRTERVSVSSTGTPGNSNSGTALGMSPDGRYVAFTGRSGNWFPTGSDPDDLVLGGEFHVFRYDRRTGTLDWLSVRPGGASGPRNSFGGTVSADGRFVAFRSLAQDLVANDGNNDFDTFLRDLGPSVGVGGLTATASGDTLAGASLVPRPDDYFVRLDVRRMPAVAGLDLTAGGARFRVLATGASFALLRRDGAAWTPVATLEGGYGTTGLSIVVAVPRDLLPSGPIQDLRAFTEAGVS